MEWEGYLWGFCVAKIHFSPLSLNGALDFEEAAEGIDLPHVHGNQRYTCAGDEIERRREREREREPSKMVARVTRSKVSSVAGEEDVRSKELQRAGGLTGAVLHFLDVDEVDFLAESVDFVLEFQHSVFDGRDVLWEGVRMKGKGDVYNLSWR